MRPFDGQYLKSVLSLMGLLPSSVPSEGDGRINADVITRAAQWALRDSGASLGNYRPVPLQPVIASLANDSNEEYWFKPQPLTIDSSFLPVGERPQSQELDAQFAKLKQALVKYQGHEVKLYTALKFHGSTFAVSEQHVTLPLFDFVKVVSALAHCLDQADGRVVLLGGNLSGIQNYLYEIISRRASKLLKGRSFYLHLLSDTVSGWAVENFDVTPCHILYNSGGGFYLLLPYNDQIVGDLEDFQQEVAKKLFEVHKLSLFFDIEWTDPFDEGKPLPEVWKELLLKLNRAKFKRLSNNPALLEEAFSKPLEQGAEEPRDAITNEELSDGQGVYLGEESSILVSRFTRGQIEQLGRRLREAKYWISTDLQFEGSLVRNSFTDAFGRSHLLTAKHPTELVLPEDAIIRKINDPVEDLPFVFYGGNDVPVFDQDTWEKYENREEFRVGWPKPFDCLAEGVRLDRLGILRMDVDNLGAVFSEMDDQSSFVRYATLSRALDWFFKGYLNTIRKNNKKYKERTIIIYSGGDDMFVVGRWLEVFDFAVEINKAFEKWSCGALSLSGGMAIVPSKFPVMQGAKMAGFAEELAKNFTNKRGQNKNAFAIMGKTFGWKDDIPILMQWRNRFFTFLNEKKIDKSFFGRINIHAYAREEQEKKGLPKRWVWRLVYDLNRLKGKSEDSEVNSLIDQVVKTSVSGKFEEDKDSVCNMHALDLLYTASRIVELEDRTIQ